MSEENKQVVKRVLEEVWSGNVDAADDLIAPDFAMDSNLGSKITGPGAAKQFVMQNRGAFPDLQLTVDDMVAEGDRVVARFTASGTQRGQFMGNRASNRRAQVQGVSIFRVVNGKVTEGWGLLDTAGVMQQIGAGPPGGGPPGQS